MIHTELTIDECWERLEAEWLGHLALRGRPGVDIFPVNFTVDERTIVFKTAPGNKLVELTKHPSVAFEVDGHDKQVRWSVVVKGEASRLDSDDEIEASGVLDLLTASPTAKRNFVRITPTSVTGRQFSLLDTLAEPV